MESNSTEYLADRASATEMVLAQVICNRYRLYKWLTTIEIAKRWIEQSGDISEREWIIGAHALISFFRHTADRNSEEAIALLNPPELRYKEFANRYRRPGRLKGMLVDPEIFKRAKIELLSRVLAGDERKNPTKVSSIGSAQQSRLSNLKLSGIALRDLTQRACAKVQNIVSALKARFVGLKNHWDKK